MANVNAYGSLIGSAGATVPLLNTAQTEASEEEIKTDAALVGSAQTAGTFYVQQYGATPIVQAGIVTENDFSYCFVRSAGKIKLALPMGSGISGGSQGLPSRLPYPKALASGDQVICMANATSDREAAVSVACTNGEYHCFSVTASSSGEQEFVSVLDGQGIGVTLQGRRVAWWMASSGNNDAELTSPVYLLDGSGVPMASVGFTGSGSGSAMVFQPCVNGSIALNSRLVFRTDA
ncbi:MAG TPA: hypothetical protein EYN66_09470 [Myxococcales bacterium]|nr:hypothetical protein [Myxococcales bacterium]